MKVRQIAATLAIAGFLVASALWLFHANRAVALWSGGSSVPGTMTYQGMLNTADGPVDGDVNLSFALYASSTGGSPLWLENHPAVAVDNGLFSAVLGSQGAPLTAGLFDSGDRWLQVSAEVNESPVTFPRQALHAVPYALHAERAQYALEAAHAMTATLALEANLAQHAQSAISAVVANTATVALEATHAMSATTALEANLAQHAQSAISAVVANTATVALEALSAPLAAGAPWQNVIIVAKSGGDYASIAEALTSVDSPGADNPWLVWVAPGIYSEASRLDIPSHVHLQGSGQAITTIETNISGGNFDYLGGAAVRLHQASRISNLTVQNKGAGQYTTGIYAESEAVTASTVIENVTVRVDGAGGLVHVALMLSDAAPLVQNSAFQASGAATPGNALNLGMLVRNDAGGFPQPVVEGSKFQGQGVGGIGVVLQESAASFRNSVVSGDHRAIQATQNGTNRFEHSVLSVSAQVDAFLFESTNSAAILVSASLVSVPVGNKHTGTGNLVCVHNYGSNWLPLSNGSTAATACN